MFALFLNFGISNLNYSLLNTSNSILNVTITNIGISQLPSYLFNYPCSSSSECTPYVVNLPKGVYLLEAWGASGGSYFTSSSNGGLGGYSFTVLEANLNSRLFIYVGGKGDDCGHTLCTSSMGGYNGGGNGGTGIYPAYTAAPGGGATDFRLGLDYLNSRILVAGGGGGSAHSTKGGNAGGLSAEAGSDYETYSKGGGAGTQSNGGYASTRLSSTQGSLGFGGRGSNYYSIYSGGGGGGGYYGGGGGSSSSNVVDSQSGGGGGSSFIKVQTEGYYYGIIPQIFSGSQSFSSPYGGFETGHKGHGCARLTVLDDPTNSINIVSTPHIQPALSPFSNVLLMFLMVLSFLIQ